MPTGAKARPAFSPYMIERGSVEKRRSSMITVRSRAGIGTSVKTLNMGTIDLPLFTVTSLVSQEGFGEPSKGDPPMSRNVALSVDVEAGTVTPAGAPLVPSPTTAG